MCISGRKRCSFLGKFGLLCFLETPVLRFALLPYYRRLSLDQNRNLFKVTEQKIKMSYKDKKSSLHIDLTTFDPPRTWVYLRENWWSNFWQFQSYIALLILRSCSELSPWWFLTIHWFRKYPFTLWALCKPERKKKLFFFLSKCWFDRFFKCQNFLNMILHFILQSRGCLYIVSPLFYW